MTISMPSNARCKRLSSRTSPIKYLMQGSLNTLCISVCFSSSRLNTTSLFGLYFFRTISTNFFPKEPVPPVIKILFPSNDMLSPLRFFLCVLISILNVFKFQPFKKTDGLYVVRIDVGQKSFDAAMAFHEKLYGAQTETFFLVFLENKNANLVVLGQINTPNE